MIEQFGDVWRALMSKADDLEARLVLDQAYQRLAGLDRTSAEGLDTDTLLELLTPDRLAALAELTYFRTLRFAKSLGEDEVQDLSLRALTLLVHTQDEDIAERSTGRVQDLLASTKEILSPELAAKTLAFLTLGGAYARAEDLLFAQLDRWPKDQAPAALLGAGEALYQELRQLPDEKLLLGNLPRDEIDAGLRSLHTHTSERKGSDT